MVRRIAVRISILVGCVGLALLAGGTPGVGSTTVNPSYSATGVCVGGVPEFAFSFTGFPVGQSTPVNLDLYDGPDAGGMQETTVGPSGMATVLWNTSSPDFGPGTHVVAAYIASSSSVESGQRHEAV